MDASSHPSSLGPYRVDSVLGVGGMGTVYRAWDSRVGRAVALKVIRESLAGLDGLAERFRHEAMLVARLSHPNIVTLFDIGIENGCLFLVYELLEGKSLREHLDEGPLAPLQVLRWGGEIAAGLGAAHERGIIHRDLKPENVFITREGHAKLLDFGIAKLVDLPGPDHALPSAAMAVGTVIGTSGYMSPEQVRGHVVGPQSDLFVLGALLYEMFSGYRAFLGASLAESHQAILHDEPPPLASLCPGLPQAILDLVHQCLAKAPESRPPSARAVQQGLAEALEHEILPGMEHGPARERASWIGAGLRVRALAALAVALALGGLLAALILGPAAAQQFSLRRLTYRRGQVLSARFHPSGIVYSASWEGGPFRTYLAAPDVPGSDPMRLPEALLLAVGPGGELAINQAPQPYLNWMYRGTLARATPGAAPKQLADGVVAADWCPGTTEPEEGLAVVTCAEGKSTLEFPMGRPRYQQVGWINFPRVQPKRRPAEAWVAFLDHPQLEDNAGNVSAVDPAGRKHILSAGWGALAGLAWQPDGREVWFSGARTGVSAAIYAVDLRGRLREVLRLPGAIGLKDIAPDGRVLATVINSSTGLLVNADGRDRDLSYLDWSNLYDFRPDLGSVLFTEEGYQEGPKDTVFLRPLKGGLPTSLGVGRSPAISPDGSRVAVFVPGEPPRLRIVPTGVGRPVEIASEGIGSFQRLRWLPSGKELLFSASAPGRPPRLWRQALDSTVPRPISPEGVTLPRGAVLSPDGALVAALAPEGRMRLYDCHGGMDQAGLSMPGLEEGEQVVQWTPEGRSVYVMRPGIHPEIHLVDRRTGARRLWKELGQVDAAASYIPSAIPAPDGSTWAYNCRRVLSELYLIEGLK